MHRDRRTTSTIASEIAPEVDPAWADAFLLEARLLEVPGDRIGDALKEVDAHCRDSGASAAAAFGEPEAYARSIAAASPRVRGSWSVHLAPLGVQIAGMSAVIMAVGALARAEPVTLTWGSIALVAVVLVGSWLVGLALDRALRAVLRRPIVSALALGATATTIIGIAALAGQWLDAPIATVPAGAVGIGGGVLLAAGIAAEGLVGRSGIADDPIVDPTRAAPRRRGALGGWLVLGWTALGCLAVWLLPGLVG